MNAAAISRKTWTDAELLALPESRRWELWDGEPRFMSPSGAWHSVLSGRIYASLLDFVESRRLGLVLDSSGGFRMADEFCFAADAAFVRRERLAADLDLDRFLPFAPDLVVEVLSPGNTIQELERKIRLCFEHGSSIAWLVLPGKRAVRIYASAASFETLGETDTLRGAPLLPGYALPLAQLFKPLF